VHTRAADAFARQERSEPAHRQRLLRGIVADRERVFLRIHHEVVVHHVAQLVAHGGHGKIGLGAAHAAALQGNDLQAGGTQFLREYPARPAQSRDNDIDLFQPGRHAALLQLMSEMPTGSTEYFLSRYFSTFW
jgi:hypothetical protein